MVNFEIRIDCDSGGTLHSHTILVEAGHGGIRNVSKQARVRLQYTCPLTGKASMLTFTPPEDAARPFAVARVG